MFSVLTEAEVTLATPVWFDSQNENVCFVLCGNYKINISSSRRPDTNDRDHQLVTTSVEPPGGTQAVPAAAVEVKLQSMNSPDGSSSFSEWTFPLAFH